MLFTKIISLFPVMASMFTINLLSNCRNDASRGTHGVHTDSFYLRKTSPVYNIPLTHSFLQNPPDVIQFTVMIKNKKLELFHVDVLLTDSVSSIPIGNFTAYPLDKGDNYEFRINEVIKKFSLSNEGGRKRMVYIQFKLSYDKDISTDFEIFIQNFRWIHLKN